MSALLRALGRTEEAKAELKKSRSVTSTKTAGAVAAHLEGNSATRKAQIKGRLLRAVKREITKARKANPDIGQEELRRIAGRAFASEVKAIRAGKVEIKPKRGRTSQNDADLHTNLVKARLRTGDIKGVIDDSIRQADEAKRKARRAIHDLRQNEARLNKLADDALDKYPLIGEEESSPNNKPPKNKPKSKANNIVGFVRPGSTRKGKKNIQETAMEMLKLIEDFQKEQELKLPKANNIVNFVRPRRTRKGKNNIVPFRKRKRR